MSPEDFWLAVLAPGLVSTLEINKQRSDRLGKRIGPQSVVDSQRR
jgi:hypothetical protein